MKKFFDLRVDLRNRVINLVVKDNEEDGAGLMIPIVEINGKNTSDRIEEVQKIVRRLNCLGREGE